MKKSALFSYILLIALLIGCSAGNDIVKQSSGLYFNPDTVEFKRFDNGKMWTFEDAPLDFFNDTYGFKPDKNWLEDARLSALQFASWCSASFVSEDGLVMTNHHCIDFVVNKIQKEGEDLHTNGFYAKTLEEERKIEGVYVDQLVLIEDVTDKISPAVDKGTTIEEKLKIREEKIAELQTVYAEETELKIKIVPLYNGGKYSLYGYRTYTDVRMVLALESEVGLYGGDPDNFTYPRYNCDFSFVRVYDNDKPLKTKNFYKWSNGGPKSGEPLFVIGRPGSTERLKTLAQYEYLRDVSIRNTAYTLNKLVDIYQVKIDESEENKVKYGSTFTMITNSAKVYRNQLKSLRNQYLMSRKKAFETELKMKVSADAALNTKYGTLWNDMEVLMQEKKKFAPVQGVFSFNPYTSSKYLIRTKAVNAFAEWLNAQKAGVEEGDEYKEKLDAIYSTEIDDYLDREKLAAYAGLFEMNFGRNEDYVSLFGNNSGKAAVDFILANSVSADREKLEKLARAGGKLTSANDKFLKLREIAMAKVSEAQSRLKEIADTESVLEELLGQAIFAVYGTKIPPDATATQRINDGVMKSFNYNGTIAPEYTTFYGLFNRYHSHKKEFPWDLPEKWLEAEPNMDLSTPLNFITTHDITGGSSGSPVINKNQEVVGIAFDGNIESIAGSYLYDDSANRMLSVHSEGILEAIGKVYKADRIVNELKAGKIAE